MDIVFFSSAEMENEYSSDTVHKIPLLQDILWDLHGYYDIFLMNLMMIMPVSRFIICPLLQNILWDLHGYYEIFLMNLMMHMLVSRFHKMSIAVELVHLLAQTWIQVFLFLR